MAPIRRFSLTLIAIVTFVSLAARAQDYPYEEADDEKSASPNAGDAAVPREKPDPADLPNSGTRGKTQSALFRVGLKTGAGFASFSDVNGSAKGLTVPLLFSLGWDLPYQPIFLEFETGYQGLLIGNASRLHIVPLRAGFFRRNRTGHESLWKIGLVPSLDFRIANNDLGNTAFSMVPSLTFATAFESAGFLVQPEITIYRIASKANAFGLTMLVGYRF